MAIPSRGNALLCRLRSLITIQRFNCSLAECGAQAQFLADMGPGSVPEQGHIDMSKWRKLDSRTLGISRSMISVPSWIVLNVLQSAGFETYLVGGCVRDLLLNKVPKDFDVITTAALKQIRKEFHKCEIVGRRFPICLVHVKGCVIEVSSFETVAEHSKEKEESLFSQMPSGCDRKDFLRWRNCMQRDFTVNSLFFDPFGNKIYDYANGMTDLRSLKLRTLIPAQLSFEEDCARILRGLRIAARLGLSFSKETEIAIRKLSLSITSLAKSRIMLELNYMLSYGAAEPSLCLLWRFNLLDILLPFHAAYLTQQARNQSSKSSVMLMKLFINLDKLVSCDQPSDCSLWIGLLAFHMALVNNPQSALVVWTFASVLYHGTWKEGVEFAREHALQGPKSFIPEISEAHNSLTDDELAEEVTQFASEVQDSIGALTKTDSLLQIMSRFPDLSCSGLVFVPRRMEIYTSQLFDVLVQDVKRHKKQRKNFNIDYDLLRKGVARERRFVLGKIIIETMSSGVVQEGKVVKVDKDLLHLFDSEHNPEVLGEKPNIGMRQNLNEKEPNPSENERIQKQRKVVLDEESKSIVEPRRDKIEKNELREVDKKENDCETRNEITLEHRKMGNLPSEVMVMTRTDASEQNNRRFPSLKGITEKNDKHKQEVTTEKRDRLVLSRLFR
ncbi:hypothetical protein U1Q18_039988 [Sarracenia purpurea var. burkii]